MTATILVNDCAVIKCTPTNLIFSGKNLLKAMTPVFSKPAKVFGYKTMVSIISNQTNNISIMLFMFYLFPIIKDFNDWMLFSKLKICMAL